MTIDWNDNKGEGAAFYFVADVWLERAFPRILFKHGKSKVMFSSTVEGNNLTISTIKGWMIQILCLEITRNDSQI